MTTVYNIYAIRNIQSSPVTRIDKFFIQHVRHSPCNFIRWLSLSLSLSLFSNAKSKSHRSECSTSHCIKIECNYIKKKKNYVITHMHGYNLTLYPLKMYVISVSHMCIHRRASAEDFSSNRVWSKDSHFTLKRYEDREKNFFSRKWSYRSKLLSEKL